ncbi:MAG: 3'(2'),5'-bisphosphate nucleotidase CysQ, partial [Desulfobacteraceae bacterium]|nr:3'(2'),5'-bisphosphate nucleotidase CysQ [Desulfobacteraceae bacterium]
EFIKRNGEFTINIALVKGRRPVLGVIYVPVKDVLYFALSEKGAFKLENANQIKWENRVESKEDASGRLKRIIGKSVRLPVEKKEKRPFTIIGSRSHPSQALEAYIEEKKNIHGDIDYTPAGSSLKICRVAEGSADVYPRLGPTMEWDTAAGQAIAECAGVKILTYENKEALLYNKENLFNPWFVVGG